MPWLEIRTVLTDPDADPDLVDAVLTRIEHSIAAWSSQRLPEPVAQLLCTLLWEKNDYQAAEIEQLLACWQWLKAGTTEER